MNLTKISLVILAAAVSGCAGTLQNIYEGESRPEREVSILSNVEYVLGSARVRSIDGTKVDNYGPRDSFSILPGTHSVEGFLHSGGAWGKIVGPFCIRFNAGAGRRYELDGNWAIDVISYYRGESWWMWIEDAETGEIIAESKKWKEYSLDKLIPFLIKQCSYVRSGSRLCKNADTERFCAIIESRR